MMSIPISSADLWQTQLFISRLVINAGSNNEGASEPCGIDGSAAARRPDQNAVVVDCSKTRKILCWV